MPMTSSYTYSPIFRLLWRYMFALGLVGACVLLCLGIPKVMAPRPFLAFWPVVVVAAEFGGIGPGLFATVASILCVHFILNPVFGGLNLFDWVGMTTGGIFLAGASVISIFIGRKRNIQSLQRLQAAAMKSATNGIALTDAKGVLLWVNPAFCTITGYTSEEIIGKIHWLLDGGEQNKALWENLWSTAMHREVWHGELVGRRKDGTTYVEERSVTPVTDADGRIINCVIIMQDISERKLAEDDLFKGKNFIANIMETSPVGITTVDASGRITFANSKAIAILGLSKDEISQTTYNAPIWHISDLDGKPFPDDRLPFNIVMTTGKSVFDVQHAIQWPDGKRILLSINGAPILDERGKVTGMVASIEDITQRKLAEEELKKRNVFVETLLENAPIGFAVNTITDGKRVYVSRNFERIYGIAQDSVNSVADYFEKVYLDPVFREQIRERIMTDMATGEAAQMRWENIPITTQTAEHKVVTAINIPLLDQNLMISTVQDVTERNRAEEEQAKLEAQLRQAQKMESVGRLAGGIAHDFNNMLGVIIGHAEIAMDKADNNQSLQADIQEIRNAAERSAALTRQLLAFARKQIVNPKVVDLNDTVAGMLKMMQRLIGEDIHLVWQPDSSLWPVKIDPSQLDQLLANLCINARDAIAGVGKLTIETENISFDEDYCANNACFVPGEYVLLAVSDDGCGMDKVTIDKIFEPFFTTKDVGHGTGLGLATVYGIVKQNGGFINVYSEPGQGTTFKIYLPRHIGKGGQARTEVALAPLQRGQESILLVEDELPLLELGKRMLETQGYRVLSANTASEAIRLAGQYAGEIHLLMTDVVMPEMNGRDLADKILALNPILKCLFTSGYTSNVIAHHGVLDENVHFIQKPFSRRDLAAKVREVLDGK